MADDDGRQLDFSQHWVGMIKRRYQAAASKSLRDMNALDLSIPIP